MITEISPLAGGYTNLTRPIVDVWRGLINRAKMAKQRFNDRADQIMSFYSGGPGAMWRPDYLQRFMGGTQAISAPKFKITSNAAFENVAIFGPLLFWEMCDRSVKPHRTMQLDPRILASGNQQAIEYFEGLAQQQAMQDERNVQRAQVLEHVLNYFSREQSYGGLAAHSDTAIFEALTKGCGFLKTEDYRFPFSERTMVGSFFESVDDILVDADCMDPLWETADWIAIRHKTKVRATEERFNLPENSLTDYATCSSNSAAYSTAAKPMGPQSAAGGIERDLIEWYEIYSRAGFGNKLTGKKVQDIAPNFDDARRERDPETGEAIGPANPYCYLCICTKCPYPLNLPAAMFNSDIATPKWVKAQTDWPTEYWRDNKWPVEMLYFYPHSGTSAWPEPPLAPALGELTCLNILMSAYIQQAYEGRQTVGGYMKGAIANIEALKNSVDSPCWVELDPAFASGLPGVKTGINDVLSYLNRPQMNGDLLDAIQFVGQLIKRRTGLMDEMYGQNSGAEPRSAAAYEGKMNTVNIRPEHMQKKVAAWQSRIADKEVFCMYTHVSGERDIPEILGPLGVAAYLELVTMEAPETILRGSKAVVEASGIRRPNKSKDMADLSGLQQYLLPILSEYMMANGNPDPLNGFLKAFADAGEMDLSAMMIPPPQPPDENAMAMQQAQLQEIQAKVQKLVADAQKSQADAQATTMQGQTARQDAQVKMAVAEHGMEIKQQTAQQALALKAQQAQLGHVGKQQEMLNKQDQHEQMLEQMRQKARQELGLKLFQGVQGMHQQAATHLQTTSIEDQKAHDEARRGALITQQRLLGMAAEQQIRKRAAATNGSAT